jgi:hypothetical protein
MAEASNYGLIPITRLQAIATGKANFRITPVAEHSTLVTTSLKKRAHDVGPLRFGTP